MDYYERSLLPVLSLEEEAEDIDRGVIRDLICERPCNIIMIEVRGRLFGIISRGDITRAKRAGLKNVPVNRGFTFMEGTLFMKAREIFRENEKINEIPVTDGEGHLKGMCSRNDDLLYLEYNIPWERNRYVRPFLGCLKMAYFVRPPKGDIRRSSITGQWMAEFEKAGVSCEMISFSEIPEKQHENIPVLLADEEMYCGAIAVTEGIDNGLLRIENVRTFRSYESTMSEHGYDDLTEKLAASGISVYNMFFTKEENTEGRRRLFDGMRKWLENPEARDINPYVAPFCAEGFYGELNVGNYAAEVGKLYFGVEANSIYTRMKDISSPYLNIENGERVTLGQPDEADRTIWFFGPCLIIGGYVEDKYTIESILQERLNREGYPCRVVNCGCHETPYQEMVHISSTPMKAGDIVVMFAGNRSFSGTHHMDMTEVLDRKDAPAEWLLNSPIHCNHKVNKIYADELFELMVKDGVLTGKYEEGKKILPSAGTAVNSLYLDLQVNDYHPAEGETIGSIVMHADPLTRGHLYLIRTAAKAVDRLFVLVIQDEAGTFTYAERYAMVAEATKDLPNVRVIAAGPFHGTRNTFREYYLKVEPSDIQDSANADIMIFGKFTAKRLGVTRRFLGNEKDNPKMQYYNELAKEKLPAYGVEVTEIPRAEVNGKAISATTARKAASEGDLRTLAETIPESSLRFFIGDEERSAADRG